MTDITKEILAEFDKEFVEHEDSEGVKVVWLTGHGEVKELKAFLEQSISKAVKGERKRIFTHLVKADMSEFCKYKKGTIERHHFYNGTNAMLTVFQKLIKIKGGIIMKENQDILLEYDPDSKNEARVMIGNHIIAKIQSVKEGLLITGGLKYVTAVDPNDHTKGNKTVVVLRNHD